MVALQPLDEGRPTALGLVALALTLILLPIAALGGVLVTRRSTRPVAGSAVQGLDLPGTRNGLLNEQAELRRSIAETEPMLKGLNALPAALKGDGADLPPGY